MNEAPRPSRRRRSLVIGLAALGVAVTPFVIPGVAAPKVAHASRSTTSSRIVGDFNGDGYQDVAVSDVSTGGNDTGQVIVYYGGPNGLDTQNPQVFSPFTAGMPSQLTAFGHIGEGFGFSVVTGHFDGGTYSELAIGVADWDFSNNFKDGPGGAVVILKGGPNGLSTAGSQFIPAPTSLYFSGDTGGVGFGWSLASGDFKRNGFTDLAIASPFASVGSTSRVGAVTLMYGSASGLGPAQTVINENTAGMPGPAAAYDDAFGWNMAVGDFKHNGFADLAIASPGHAGDVVLYGSSSGLTTTGSQYLQGVGPEGYQLASGDFTGNGFDDLAVGESCPNIVEIHYGSSTGLGSVAFHTAQEITAKSIGMPQEDHYFAESVAAGDIKNNGRDDLVIGGEPTNVVVWGTSTKLTNKGAKTAGDSPYGDPILGLADVNGDGHADLLAGWPYAESSGIPAAQINVYDGSALGLAGTRAYSLTQQVPAALSLSGNTAAHDVSCGGA